MSVTHSIIQASSTIASTVSLAQVVRGVLSLAALTGFVMFFRPLLVGIARALALWMRPRLTEQQLAERRQLHNSYLLRRGVSVASTPADPGIGSAG